MAITHYTGIYWFMPGFVAGFIFAPVQSAPVPPLASAIVNVPFNPGVLGVALFFMISGFVIPFSLRHHDIATFLIARVLRIYPPYCAAMAIGLAARYLSARYWGQHFDAGTPTIVANALLFQDMLSIPSIDQVNWTLTIELKFYLLFALAHALIPRWGAWLVLAAGAAAVAVNLTAVDLMPHLSARGQGIAGSRALESMCIAYMLLGTLFFMRHQGLLSLRGPLVAPVTGLALFQASWAAGPTAQQFRVVSDNYVYGWLIFALCFVMRGWFVPVALPQYLAEISYPLYLVHSMVGYAVMTLLITGYGLGYTAAAGIALAVAVALLYLINRLVERRSIAMGRSIGSRRALSVPSMQAP